MARSVSTPSGAEIVVYSHVDTETEAEWHDMMHDLRSSIKAAFPSMEYADRWLDREDHVIAENSFACIGISEYCSLVSIWIVPDNDLGAQWARNVEKRLQKIVTDVFGMRLAKLGHMSNGEGVYQRVDA